MARRVPKVAPTVSEPEIKVTSSGPITLAAAPGNTHRGRWARWWAKFDVLLLERILYVSLFSFIWAAAKTIPESVILVLGGLVSASLTAIGVLLRADGGRHGDDHQPGPVIAPAPPPPGQQSGRCNVCGAPCQACASRG